MRKVTFAILAGFAVVFAMLPLAAWAFFLGSDEPVSGGGRTATVTVAVRLEAPVQPLAFELRDAGCPFAAGVVEG